MCGCTLYLSARHSSIPSFMYTHCAWIMSPHTLKPSSFKNCCRILDMARLNRCHSAYPGCPLGKFAAHTITFRASVTSLCSRWLKIMYLDLGFAFYMPEPIPKGPNHHLYYYFLHHNSLGPGIPANIAMFWAGISR